MRNSADEVRGIPVRIRFDGSQYFVSDIRLDLYGAGSSIGEALEDYWLAVEDCYADLSEHADRLADHLCDHLAYLRQVLGEA
jgi:uncharacterized protein (DUF433 family)